MSEVHEIGRARGARRAGQIRLLLSQLQAAKDGFDLASESAHLDQAEREVMAEIAIDLEGQLALLAEAFPAKS